MVVNAWLCLEDWRMASQGNALTDDFLDVALGAQGTCPGSLLHQAITIKRCTALATKVATSPLDVRPALTALICRNE